MGSEKSDGLKIYSLEENLKQGMAAVSHVAGKNVNLPILNNILVRADEGKIRLIATNLEIGITATVRGKIDRGGAFTVNAKIMADCVGLLPNKKICLEQSSSADLSVDCENYQAKIKGQGAEEFPLIPEVDRKTFYSASAQAVKQAIGQVIFATAQSETRLELSGVLFNFSGQSLTVAATDSYRLAEKRLTVKAGGAEDRKIIVPARTLQEVLRVLSVSQEEEAAGADQEIKFYVTDNQILFVYGSIELVSRLIEGQYPDYQQIIPLKAKTKAQIDRAELIRAVKMASLFSKPGVNDINLDFPAGKNQLVVSSVSGQTGENITSLSAGVAGEDNSIVVNYRYLLEGLNSLESETVSLDVVDGNTPCVIRPAQENGYLYIIMPIKQ